MEFKFPDSGRSIKIEGYSSLNASLIRGWYEDNYPNKPVEPVNPLDTLTDGKVNTAEFKAKEEQYNLDKEEYTKAIALWTVKMNQARWAGIKQYYASCVAEVDTEAVEKTVKQFKLLPPHIDLREVIVSSYKDLGVEFEPEYIDAYIYLFHVCISNTGDQTLFENALMLGTAPTQEAVQAALFRFRGQI